MPDDLPDDPSLKPGPPIEKELGNLDEIKERLNALGISYDVPLQTFHDIATAPGTNPETKRRAAEELAKVMRLYPDKNSKPVVVETTGEVVRVYLPDNGRDATGDENG